jgi:hypothetical protein
MDGPIPLPLDDLDRLADPPLLDFLHEDPVSESWAITFVPSDDVSDEQNETIVVKKRASSEARYVQILLNQVQSLASRQISTISHLGGGNYTLTFASGATRRLDEFENATAVEIFDRLRQIALNAELIFRIEHRALRMQARRPA